MKKTLALLALLVAGVASADEPTIYTGTALTLNGYKGNNTPNGTYNAGSMITVGRASFSYYLVEGVQTTDEFASWLVSLTVDVTTSDDGNYIFATSGKGSNGTDARNYCITYNANEGGFDLVYRTSDGTATKVLTGLTFTSGQDVRLAYNAETNIIYFGNYTTGQCLTQKLQTDEALRFNSVDQSTAAHIFTNSGDEDVTVNMVANMANVDTATFIAMTPEPATATLSLLALAGLVARRRRH